MNIFKNKNFSIVWAIIRVWLGYQWFMAGYDKFHEANWMNGTALKGFLSRAAGLIPNTPAAAHYGWYQSFTASLVNSGAYTWFAPFVAVGELLVGIALILGIFTSFAAVMGAFMNLNYMLAGSTSTNPVMYTFEILLLLAGLNAGLIGLDYFVIPYLRKLFGRQAKSEAA